MTKEQIYKALKDDGAKLKLIRFYSDTQIHELYVERFGHEPGDDSDKQKKTDTPEADKKQDKKQDNSSDDSAETSADKKSDKAPDKEQDKKQDNAPSVEAAVKIHTLVFDRSGWCEKLNTSYFRGNYRPKTVNEYVILRKYAAREI